MMPALPGLPLQRDSPQLIIINMIVSIMPARHRDRDSGSRRKLSTIRPSACPRRVGMSVHDALESLDSISRNTHAHPFKPNLVDRRRFHSRFFRDSLGLLFTLFVDAMSDLTGDDPHGQSSVLVSS
jgi:hypothetical protein